MKKIFTILSIVGLSHIVTAQINVGAIAFLGFQADAPDAFAFVTLQDFNAGDSLFFTDAGWNGSLFFVNEGSMGWKADQAIPAGAVVRIQDPNNASIPNALIEGPGLTRGKITGLTLAGDQLFAYTLVNGNQVPIAAFSTNAFISQCDASGIGNTPRSCLPSNLTLGINAIQLNDNAPASANPDNAFFNQAIVSGTPEEIAQIVNNASNWSTDEEPTLAGYDTWPNWQFSVGSIGEVQIGFVLNSLSLIEGGNPQQIEISINPPLNLHKIITLQFALENGIEANDISTSPNHTNGIIELELPANVNVYNFSISAGADDGTEGTETGILRITGAETGLVITQDSLINFEIIEDPSTSFVSFSGLNNNEVGIEGQSYSFNLIFTPVTAENASVTIAFESSNGFNQSDFITDPPAFTSGIIINVPAGTSSLPISFQSIDDIDIEPTENVQMLLSDLSNNLELGVSTTINFTIADNDIPVTYQNLNINELMVNNTLSISDEFSEYDDWIEIQNSGDAAVSLAGLFITNDPLVPNKFQFSSSPLCNLSPGAFKLVWADDSIEQGPLHLNFELNNLGGYVGLYSLQAGNLGLFYALIDSVYYPAMGANESYSFFADLEENWLVVNNATPLSTNELPVGEAQIEPLPLQVFPNPANEVINIRLNDTAAESRISWYTNSGQLIISELVSNKSLFSIQTNHFPSGIYFYTIQSENSYTSGKISICH